MSGRWMDVRVIVPFPAMLRSVSGRRRIMRKRARDPRQKRNQNMAW